MQRIDEFINEAAAIEDAPGSTQLAPFSDAITLNNVSFAYDGVSVLDAVSLTIRRGSNHRGAVTAFSRPDFWRGPARRRRS